MSAAPFNKFLIHRMARRFAIVSGTSEEAEGDSFTFSSDKLMRYVEEIASFMQAQRDYNADAATDLRAALQAQQGEAIEEAFDKGYARAVHNSAPGNMDLGKLAMHKHGDVWYFACDKVRELAKKSQSEAKPAPATLSDEPFCYMSETYEVALLTEPPKADGQYADMFPVYRAAQIRLNDEQRRQVEKCLKDGAIMGSVSDATVDVVRAALAAAGSSQGQDGAMEQQRQAFDRLCGYWMDRAEKAERALVFEKTRCACVNEELAEIMPILDNEWQDWLRAKFFALSLDAERYRWLRDISEPGICAFYLSVGQAFHGVRFARETVDEAIDAQIVALAARETK
jgi:hypothetical protein